MSYASYRSFNPRENECLAPQVSLFETWDTNSPFARDELHHAFFFHAPTIAPISIIPNSQYPAFTANRL